MCGRPPPQTRGARSGRFQAAAWRPSPTASARAPPTRRARCPRARRWCKCPALMAPPRPGPTTPPRGCLRGAWTARCAWTRAPPSPAPPCRPRCRPTAAPPSPPPRAPRTCCSAWRPWRRRPCWRRATTACRGWACRRCGLERRCTACCLAAARRTLTRPLATQAPGAQRPFPQGWRSAPPSTAPRLRPWAAPSAPRRARSSTKAALRRAFCSLQI